MEALASTSATCAHCQKPATLTCGACKDAPDYDQKLASKKTRYCTTECQRLDWVRHKGVCKTLKIRKLFFRAGSVLQELFYMYREEMFDVLVDKVVHFGSTMYVHEGKYPFKYGAQALASVHDIVFPFPTSFVPDLQDKQALLANLACDDSVGWFHEIAAYLFKDIVREVVELEVQPKNIKRQVIKVSIDGSPENFSYHHVLLQIRLRNGEEYALDLTGAQYGYYEPIQPFKAYLDSRVAINLTLRDNLAAHWGSTKETIVGHTDASMGTPAGNALILNSETSKGLASSVRQWELEQKMPLGTMLLLSQRDFEQRQSKLVAYVKGEIHSYLQYLEGRKKEEYDALVSAAIS